MEATKTGHATDQEANLLVQCACGAENPAGRRFCTRCGTSLAEPCFRCGLLAMADQRFCGGCGAELAATAHRKIEQCELDLRNADQCEAQGRLDEALSLLIPISKLTHARMLRHVAEAKEKIKRISLARDRGIQEAAPALEEGRRRMAAQDYAGAVKVLQAIPASVRSSEFTALLEQAQAGDREVTALGNTLREAVASKQFAALPKVVSRLLELQPRHGLALAVGAKFQTTYLRAAEEKLGQYQYEQALKVLEQIPRPLWTASTVQFHQRVADLAWLAATLRTAPVIDPVLEAAGRRAAELMPGDPGFAKLTKEIQRRVKRNEKDDGIVPQPWAAPPAESALGLPLEWRAGFQRIVLSEKCDYQALVEGRGCYGVACGLALQGLGLAAIEMDLRIKAKASVIDFVSSMVRGHGSHAWGIDIGSSSVKAVKLVAGKKGESPQLEIALCIEHQKSLGQANNEDEEQILLEETLANLLARHDLKSSYVAVGLPGRMVFSRMFKLPPSDKRKLETMVQHEVQRHMPVHIDGLAWDYATLEHEGADVPAAKRNGAANGTAIPKGKAVNGATVRTKLKKSWNVVVAAVRRAHVEKRLAVLDKLGVKPDVVQSECTALYNLLAYELGATGAGPAPRAAAGKNGSAWKDPPAGGETAPPAGARPGDAQEQTDPLADPVAVVDLGHESSRLLVCSSNELWVRNLGFGGQLLTRALVKEFNLTTAEAERYKRDPLAAPSVAQVYRAAAPVLDDLLNELQVALVPLSRTDERPPIQKVYLLGGSVLFHGLLQFLQAGK